MVILSGEIGLVSPLNSVQLASFLYRSARRRRMVPGREHHRRHVPQTAMRPPMVVLVLSPRRQHFGLRHVREDLGVEQFVTKPRVEALASPFSQAASESPPRTRSPTRLPARCTPTPSAGQR